VISDAEFGSRPAGRKVLAYVRVKESPSHGVADIP